jgi:hypothetical protein
MDIFNTIPTDQHAQIISKVAWAANLANAACPAYKNYHFSESECGITK